MKWSSIKLFSSRTLAHSFLLRLNGSLNLLQILYVAILLFLLQLWELVPLALLLAWQVLLEERKQNVRENLLREGRRRGSLAARKQRRRLRPNGCVIWQKRDERNGEVRADVELYGDGAWVQEKLNILVGPPKENSK